MGNELSGMDRLRSAVNALNGCSEEFLDAFTAEELLKLADAHRQCKWDILPDTWTERQIRQCLKRGKIPEFREKDGDIVAKYPKAPATAPAAPEAR